MNKRKRRTWLSFFYKYASYKYYLPLVTKVAPWAFVISAMLAVAGLVSGLAMAPPDYQQGNSFRIFYIHVPAAILSTAVYATMAILSGIYLIWRIKLFAIIARSLAILGAAFTLVSLVTGALWGAPAWGTWWVWDVRLTSQLILFFLYMGYIALDLAIEERERADKAISVLALVGLINVPIVKFSIYFSTSLHQGSTLFAKGGPSITSNMLYPALYMFGAYLFFSLGYVCLKSANLINKERLMKHYMRG